MEDISNRMMRDFATCLSSRLADAPVAPSGEEIAKGEAPPEAAAAAAPQEGADYGSRRGGAHTTATAAASACCGQAGGWDRSVLLRPVGADHAPLRAGSRFELTRRWSSASPS